MQKKSSLKLYKNYKKNIIEWFYALYRYILLKFHRQVPAPGPNFSVAGHRTCQDRAWRRPCKYGGKLLFSYNAVPKFRKKSYAQHFIADDALNQQSRETSMITNMYQLLL